MQTPQTITEKLFPAEAIIKRNEFSEYLESSLVYYCSPLSVPFLCCHHKIVSSYHISNVLTIHLIDSTTTHIVCKIVYLHLSIYTSKAFQNQFPTMPLVMFSFAGTKSHLNRMLTLCKQLTHGESYLQFCSCEQWKHLPGTNLMWCLARVHHTYEETSDIIFKLIACMNEACCCASVHLTTYISTSFQ